MAIWTDHSSFCSRKEANQATWTTLAGADCAGKWGSTP